MIKPVKYLNGGCLNLTCLRPTEALKYSKFIAPVDFDALREMFTIPKEGLTNDEMSARVDQVVELVKRYHNIDTVWLRPIVVGQPLHGMVEDALLCEGYKVVYQRNEVVGLDKDNKPQYKQQGWWEMIYE